MNKLRIAAFGGFRSIPPKEGAAGSDKFAFELYPRIVNRGHSMVAYCRIYPGNTDTRIPEFENIKLKYFKTVNKAGFDTLLHSAKATFDILYHNTADIVHIHSGANSIWAMLLRLGGKRVVVSQFAMDWKRNKWPWYGKLFYILSNYITAYLPNKVVFDNVFTKDYFERKFNRAYNFIPYGSEVRSPPANTNILQKIGLYPKEYFLFVGRFITDKGLHLLLEAFGKIQTKKKLVLVGGSPNPSKYEENIKNTSDNRVIFPGYVYGDDTNILIQNAFAYIQPSLIEGLSPVILTVMGLETPLICSNIRENVFITKSNAIHFASGDVTSLIGSINYALNNTEDLYCKAKSGKTDVSERFNWENITNQYIELFKNMKI
jgi:glycosyltransferase involved in cell wall biosynthesis